MLQTLTERVDLAKRLGVIYRDRSDARMIEKIPAHGIACRAVAKKLIILGLSFWNF
jgi:hypothetical protein